MSNERLSQVYAAQTEAEASAAYNAWASDYDADLMRMGYRLPWHMAAAILTHVPQPAGPILDAGCGTGLPVEPLHLVGWRGFTGVDLSEGMLNVAREKGIYDTLQQITLADPLPFEPGTFNLVISCGTITPGHAPIETLDDLARVTRKGGHLAISLRHDTGQDPQYLSYFDKFCSSDLANLVFSTPDFATMPLGEPDVRNKVHIFEVLT